ncbi:uncharacterized protein LOC123429258 isoform X2 [Hordeum vulgare subsp. vulgare]|uniref:uncharacterized protein LOC123429258 isoform X2 n=1 Tax=Hordeum vulgare subsp. vulgare TaxID=112509 RepID=UPI001D1A4DFC|nr:uncharacterized protein LOC123429258 isoform X2 [Hordeum vulgare subsp. vulgare]
MMVAPSTMVAELLIGIKHWWKKSTYAYLNEPAVTASVDIFHFLQNSSRCGSSRARLAPSPGPTARRSSRWATPGSSPPFTGPESEQTVCRSLVLEGGSMGLSQIWFL